ncbi:hypothetical protein CEXT_28991 [Caerostris extrusa]|uniref:Uncharacterized protein n=1 Tax=Caerostris extrusa TaxID=172846 RepID=A0AAV4U0P3_CAEEX|nr:hypothetical protein CEXT_28991 [Caerostris extrusa]
MGRGWSEKRSSEWNSPPPREFHLKKVFLEQKPLKMKLQMLSIQRTMKKRETLLSQPRLQLQLQSQVEVEEFDSKRE